MLTINAREYGISGDGVTVNTEKIQKAIEECTENGGGRIVFEGGTFLTGCIHMKSNVELHIDFDAVLMASEDPKDFPEPETDRWNVYDGARHSARCMIYAEAQENIAITGRGVIDGNGAWSVEPNPKNDMRWEFKRVGLESIPRVVFFTMCRNVRVYDVTMRNQPSGWSYWISGCEDVIFDRVVIDADVRYPNNDGIHINCSKRVVVANSNITCGDDSLIVRAYSKPLNKPVSCENVTITNCNLRSHSSGIRIAWTNDGTIRNCTFSNLTMNDCNTGVSIIMPRYYPAQTDVWNEPTLVEHLSFDNITMNAVYHQPIYINAVTGEDRPAPENFVAGIRDLYFSNIHATAYETPFIRGTVDVPVENLYFSNCTFRQLPRKSAAPATPTFTHVKNLVMNNTVFDVL